MCENHVTPICCIESDQQSSAKKDAPHISVISSRYSQYYTKTTNQFLFLFLFLYFFYSFATAESRALPAGVVQVANKHTIYTAAPNPTHVKKFTNLESSRQTTFFVFFSV